MMDDAQLGRIVRIVEEHLSSGQLHEALRALNSQTSHRFTGVYRVDPPLLRNVALFDLHNPDLVIGDDAPLRETYCSITSAQVGPFTVTDADQDERVTDHPARESTRSYCGVPLRDQHGEPFGTLCHFDLEPKPLGEGSVELLSRVSGGFARLLLASGREVR